MFSLEEPKGLSVGATTFLSRLPSPVRSGNAKIKGIVEEGLLLEEVAFTAYYPAQVDSKSRKGLDWFTRPLNLLVEGYVRFSAAAAGKSPWIIWAIFAPMVYLYGRFLRLPVYPNARLLKPSEASKKQWPLVIFSHGLAGSRTAYSQVCSRIAATGRVVLAIEHRDGSGPSCLTRSWDSEGKCTTKPIFYIPTKDATYEDSEGRTDPIPLRADQLFIRRHEVYHTYKAFSQFFNGSGLDIAEGGKLELSDWFEGTEGDSPVAFDNVCLAGHSFGGCTVFSILSTQPSGDYPRIQVSHTLIYDPWLDPFPTPGPLPVDKTDEQRSALPSMLVINSEPFTLWKEHFIHVETAIGKWGPQAKLITLARSEHQDFSDFPWLPLIRKKTRRVVLQRIEELSTSFLDGGLEAKLTESGTRNFEVRTLDGKNKWGEPKREIMGQIGDIVLH